MCDFAAATRNKGNTQRKGDRGPKLETNTMIYKGRRSDEEGREKPLVAGNYFEASRAQEASGGHTQEYLTVFVTAIWVFFTPTRWW